MPTTGTVSGLTLVQDINACYAALLTNNSGATAPTNAPSGPVTGQVWLDTSTTPNPVRIYSGSAWLIVGYLDASSGVWTPPIGGGRDTVASATTTDLCSKAPGTLTITGSTTITSFSNTCQPGQIKALLFAGAMQITHNATSMILPNNGNSITTVAGDRAWAVYLGGSNWEVLTYQRADGSPLATTAVFTGAINLSGQIAPTTLSVNTNNWAPTGLATASQVMASASAAIKVTGIVAGSNGQRITLYNTSAFLITLTAQDASSTAGNQFLMRAPYQLYPNAAVTMVYDNVSGTKGWRPESPVTAQPIAGGFSALVITNDGTNPTTTMQVSADAVTVEDALGFASRVRSVSVAPVITASGANGLDTGSVVNNIITWYAIYVIYNPNTDTVAGMYSLQSSCAAIFSLAQMPSGYAGCARVGWARTDGAATARWIRSKQIGRDLSWITVAASTNSTALPVISSGVTRGSGTGSSITYAPVSISNFVPTTAAKIRFTVSNQYPPNNVARFAIAPNADYGSFNLANNAPCGAINVTFTDNRVCEFGIESSNIYMWIDALGGGVQAMGYTDNLN